MSVSSAMYAAVTGLSALGTSLQVTSNNIANVNTVGFKAGRTNFEDLISQDYWSNGRVQQIGRGVKIASVQQMFTQGAFMNSAQDTDVAITGEGFFAVRDRLSNEIMYTRAGNFTFDKNGVLETPAGYVVQGWPLIIPGPGEDPVQSGAPTDIKIDILNAPPLATSVIKAIANLDARETSRYDYPINDPHELAGAWDATNDHGPIAGSSYQHQLPVRIYDSLGNAHDLTIYYDPNPHMDNVWDYIVAINPEEDFRQDSNNTFLANGATFAGLLQKGKITFDANGNVKDLEAANLAGYTVAAAAENAATDIDGARLLGYYKGSANRQYQLVWDQASSGFNWTDDAVPPNTGSFPVSDANYPGPYNFGSGLSVSFNNRPLPLSFTNGSALVFDATPEAYGWQNQTPNQDGYFEVEMAFVTSASMALHPPYPSGLPTVAQAVSLNMGVKNPLGANPAWELAETSTTQYGSKSTNVVSSQDGYAPGSLQRVSIGSDGVITGIYTNGRHQPLYQLGLVKFLNPWGLNKLGDNVYMETRWSGQGVMNPPGYGGTGTVRGNFLEQSNVDLAQEIVDMIITQRGFQANSKVVTTTDTMLAEVIEMKR